MTIPAEPWRVVLFSNAGNEAWVPASKLLLESFGHRLVGVVTSPGPKSRRSDSYLKLVNGARRHPGIDIVISNHPSHWAGMLAPLEPDLLISIVFSWRIPPEAVATATYGGINVHPSPLPKYRGPNPVGWAIRNGDEQMYMTIHRLVPEFDAGPILALGSFPLLDDDDDESLQPKFSELFATRLFPEALGRIAAGDPGTPQDESMATRAPFFEEDWRSIDWSKPRQRISRQIRSWTGDREIPRGAIGRIDGRDVTITKARLASTGNLAEPGAHQKNSDGTVLVQCGDGPLEILEWTPQDDERGSS